MLNTICQLTFQLLLLGGLFRGWKSLIDFRECIVAPNTMYEIKKINI